jgi:hypothetical protein
MTLYRIVAIQQLAPQGFEATICGPGVPAAGVAYWFESTTEADGFVQNLNLSYSESKRLAAWRKSQPHRRIPAPVRASLHTAAG